MSGGGIRPNTRRRGRTREKAKRLTGVVGNPWEDALHLLVLCGFAFAQPLYELLSRNFEFMLMRRPGAVDFIFIAVLLSFLVAVPAILIEFLAGMLMGGVRRRLHYFFVGVLAVIIVLPPLKHIGGLAGGIILAAAIVFGAAATFIYMRYRPARIFATALAPAVIIFPALFLFRPPVSKVLFPGVMIGGSAPEIDADIPIVMVVFDEFPLVSLLDPDGGIDQTRHPNFHRLARESYVFTNATTISGWTNIALPGLLTGRYPDLSRQGSLIYQDYPGSLFTLLHPSYELNVWESGTNLCPPIFNARGVARRPVPQRIGSLLTDLPLIFLHVILPADLSGFLPEIALTWQRFILQPDLDVGEEGARSPGRREQFRGFIGSIRASGKPALNYIHIMLPHKPYQYLPSGRAYWRSPKLLLGLDRRSERWFGDEEGVMRGLQGYLLQVGMVDRLVGELVDRLKEIGLYDRALVVIMADHGASFRFGDLHRAINDTNFQDIMLVPLFIKKPYQARGHIVHDNVQVVDILPTIADILGAEIPFKVDGKPIFPTGLIKRNSKILWTEDGGREYPPVINHGDGITRARGLFGSGSGWDGLFRLGDYLELLEKPVSGFKTGGVSSLLIELDLPEAFDAVAPESDYVPSCVYGRVIGDEAGGLPLAIAVNGTIRAVTRTFRQVIGWARFAAMVPESGFHNGRNDIGIFLVSEQEGRSVLDRLKTNIGRVYSLGKDKRGGGEFLVNSLGKVIPIRPGAISGLIEHKRIVDDRIVILGWAADVKGVRRVKAIAVFVDGRYLQSGKTFQRREDIARLYGVEMAGFTFRVQLSEMDHRGSDIRLFAVSEDGVASEIK